MSRLCRLDHHALLFVLGKRESYRRNRNVIGSGRKTENGVDPLGRACAFVDRSSGSIPSLNLSGRNSVPVRVGDASAEAASLRRSESRQTHEYCRKSHTLCYSSDRIDGAMRTYIILSLLLFTVALEAASRTTSGEFITERPTLVSLGFEWHIDGDDNHNAAVSVFYRKKGEQAWKEGLPLLRLDHERINENALQYIVPNMFAGSIFDLEPGTDYECRLVLADPDGVDGKAENIVAVHTRPEPKPAAGGNVYHVYPPGFSGQKQQPAFTGLLGAYYTGSSGADYFNAYPPRVKPGDTILVHAGVY